MKHHCHVTWRMILLSDALDNLNLHSVGQHTCMLVIITFRQLVKQRPFSSSEGAYLWLKRRYESNNFTVEHMGNDMHQRHYVNITQRRKQ